MAALVVMMAYTGHAVGPPQKWPKVNGDDLKAMLAKAAADREMIAKQRQASANKPMTDCKPTNPGENSGPIDDCNSNQDCVQKYEGTNYRVCSRIPDRKAVCCNPNANYIWHP